MKSGPVQNARAVLEALPLCALIAVLVVWQTSGAARGRVPLVPLERESAAELAANFDAHGYSWPPRQPVPRLAALRLPTDVGSLAADERKQLFLRTLLPLILAENLEIRRERAVLQEAFGASSPLPGRERQVRRIARRYKLDGDVHDPDVRARLLRRVDEIPPALALAQAANESGWGTSRFALEANNLFGLWTWDEDKGLVPSERPAGARHRVRAFPELRAAVRLYLHNLNTGHAYGELRRLRGQMRAAGQPLDPLALAAGLVPYSERGEAYVDDIRALIRGNALHLLDGHALALAE
jgi:Bax protein